MPTASQASLNPNDYSGLNGAANQGGRSPHKKQFVEQNQHYIHSGAVFPQDGHNNFGPRARNDETSTPSPFMNNVAIKPNQVAMDQLYKK